MSSHKTKINSTAKMVLCYICLSSGGTLVKENLGVTDDGRNIIGYKHQKCNSILFKRGIIQVKDKLNG